MRRNNVSCRPSSAHFGCSVPVGAIVGGVLGGLVAVSLVVAAFTWVILLRRQRRVERHEMMPSPQLGPRNQAFVKFPDEGQQEPKESYEGEPHDSFDLQGQQPSRPPPTIHEEDEEAAR